MGLYAPMLTGFKNLDLVGSFSSNCYWRCYDHAAFSKAMDYALNHYHSRVYHFILGLVISSTLLIIIPNPRNTESISYAGSSFTTFLMAALLFIAGIALGAWMSKLEEKYK